CTGDGGHSYAAAGRDSILVTVSGGATYGAGALISPAQGTAAIAITKTPTTQGVDSGGTATFTITVTNTGTVTLTNVTVTDPLSAACANTIGTLAAGQSTNYNCTQVNVTAAFTNIATVTGHPPTGPDVTASASADVTVNTPSGTPPIVTNEHTSGVDDVSATVAADIDPNGASTSYHIEYGTTTAYGQTLQSGVTSSTPFSTSDKLTGLQPSTTYHFRVVATNTAGTTNGPDASFTTGPAPSATTTTPATDGVASGGTGP